MRPSELFRTYNVNQVRGTRVLWLLIAVSTLIAAAVSLAIPQVMHSSKQHADDVAASAVGADLRVVAPFGSAAFDDALAQAQSKGEAQSVERHGLHMSSVKVGDNYQLVVVVDGEQAVAADGAVLSASLASKLHVGVGDRVEVRDTALTVERIETAGGPDSTAEAFGYIKTRASDWGPTYAQSILIESGTPDELSDELEAAETGFTYTTVSSQRAKMAEQLATSFLGLNALSTMCMLSTVLSLFSCVLLVLRQRRSHVAIMRMVAVPIRSIRFAFVYELMMIVTPAILIGTSLSPLLAQVILAQQDIHLRLSIGVLFAGFAYFFLVYSVCLFLLSKPMVHIDAYDITRGDGSGVSIRVADTFTAILTFFLAMTLFYCVVILGESKMFVSSVLVMVVVCVFGILGWVAIALATLPRWRSRLVQFTSRTTRAATLSTTSTVVSMALLLWFILFGFGLGPVFKQSFNDNLGAKLSYNYLVVEERGVSVGEKIDGADAVSGWTRMYCDNGTVGDNGATHAVTLAGVDRSQYETPFKSTSGTDLLSLNDGEVLISDRLSDQLGVRVGDTLSVDRGDEKVGYVVAGSYDSGTVNDNYVLFPVEGEVEAPRVLDLVQASDSSFLSDLRGVTVADVSSIGEAYGSLIASFLVLFQQLCMVCVVAIFFFNVSLIVMKYVQPKDLVICRAIGVPRHFLVGSFMLRQLLSFALSALLAIALFRLVSSAVVSLLLDAPAKVSWKEVYLPACAAIVMVFLLFTAFEMFQLRRSLKRYDLLRTFV